MRAIYRLCDVKFFLLSLPHIDDNFLMWIRSRRKGRKGKGNNCNGNSSSKCSSRNTGSRSSSSSRSNEKWEKKRKKKKEGRRDDVTAQSIRREAHKEAQKMADPGL